jgi:hypothetical protein
MTVRDDGGLKAALQEARLAEGAHFEAALQLRDAKSIRLQLLKDDLAPAAAAGGDIFDLVLVPGDPPRLWIDLITSVVMEPDPRTYRLQQDRQTAREILFESDDRGEVMEAARRHMAHLLVARERQAAAVVSPPPPAGYSTASLMLAWLSGVVLGALALLAMAIYMERMGF